MDARREAQIIKEFGRALKKFRNERKLSLRDLGDLADLDYTNISEIETGKKSPTAITIVKLAEALEVHPGEFFAKK